MFDYDLYKKKVISSTSIPKKKLLKAKEDTFKIALRKGYNSESVLLNNGVKIQALISRTSEDTLDTKSFSTLLENDCRIGDEIFWTADNTHWIITSRMETEEAIFQGVIIHAKHELKWRDSENGVLYIGRAGIKRPDLDILNYVKGNSITYDVFNDQLTLMMSARTPGIKTLKRYSELFVGDRKWNIEAIDTNSNPDVYIILVHETTIDRDTDNTVDKIANDVVPQFIFNTNISSISSIALNSSVALNNKLLRNGEILSDSCIIKVTNCSLNNNQIIFNRLGNAKIIFLYKDLDLRYVYDITVTEEKLISETSISISGNTTVKTLTQNSYQIDYYVDGEKVEVVDGVWSLATDVYATMQIVDMTHVILNINNKIGSFVLQYNSPTLGLIEQTIEVESIFERS